MHEAAEWITLYRKAAKRAPAKPRERAGSRMPAAPVALAEPDALLDVCVPDEPDEPEALEPDVADGEEPEEPEEPDAPAPPDVLFPLEVPLPPEPPLGVVEFPPEAVPFPRPTVGATTGTKVLLTPAG